MALLDNCSYSLLLVDNNEADAYLLQDTFARLAPTVTVHWVADLAAARARLFSSAGSPASSAPSLVLLDLHLNRDYGLTLLSEIRSHPTLFSLPVIVYSASLDARDVHRVYAAGANCYLPKCGGLHELEGLVAGFTQFWLRWSRLPHGPHGVW